MAMEESPNKKTQLALWFAPTRLLDSLDRFMFENVFIIPPSGQMIFFNNTRNLQLCQVNIILFFCVSNSAGYR